jgi:asparagine synthase (glutamine-hydrolysing)
MGFSIPLESWLRKELRPWAEDLFDCIESDSEIFNKPMIDKMWKEHISCEVVHTERIWGLLNLISFTHGASN